MSRPRPVGSPYRFTDIDWNTVTDRQSHQDVLYVVLGYQFKSDFYDSAQLLKNVEAMFQRALDYYNEHDGSASQATLHFRGLGGGYGGHLFNAIARDIIASDIAVFDTSDLNANVMLEMGVALTWGTAVFPIREQSTPPPPSDVSGQMWAVYLDSAADFPDTDHQGRLGRMVEAALRAKRLRSSAPPWERGH
jgi:hypothetical protein